MILINLLSWGLAYVVFILLLKNPYLAVMSIIVFTLLGFVMYPSLHENEIRKRLRKLYKEQYKDRNSFTCEVELTPREVRITQDRNQAVLEWKLVDEVVVTEDSVDVFAGIGGIVVRNRAFESSEARAEFIALAQSYLAASRNSTNEEIRSNDA